MDKIESLLRDYYRSVGKLSQPDISDAVVAFLDKGLTSAEVVSDSGIGWDHFGTPGSRTAYRCRNKAGESMTLLYWGCPDGCGLIDVEKLKQSSPAKEKTSRYEVAYDGGSRFVIAFDDEDAIDQFRTEWSDRGDEPPTCWIVARWAIS